MSDTFVPEGYNTINPFVVVKNGQQFIQFVQDVFGGVENEYAFTKDTDGLIIHAELKVGNSVILLFEKKPDWPHTPAFLQIYVESAEQALKRAKSFGASIITEATDIYGFIFSRIQDPFGNIWWLWEQKPTESSYEETSSDEVQWNVDSEKERYIHDTILQAMRNIGQK